MKGGVGTASIELGRGVVVGALYAVNAFGDVVDPATCRILAGARVPQRQPRPRHAVGPPRFVDTLEAMRLDPERRGPFGAGESTVIGVVATNARLDRAALGHVAAMAHDGLARAIRPAHTLVDGDTVFALSLGGEHDTDVSVIGAMAAEVTARAIVNAVLHARPAGGLPGCGHTTA
jgi:L-aminopeptidase/D-esterase-like protein